MSVLEQVNQEARAWWLSGGTMGEFLNLCPENPDVRSYVVHVFVELEMNMADRMSRSLYNPEGPIRGRLQ